MKSCYYLENSYWVVRVNQTYSRLSTTHGHITDCKLDSVVYAGVCVWAHVDLSYFGPNDLRPTVFRCQATDSFPPQVSSNESLRPFILPPRQSKCIWGTFDINASRSVWVFSVLPRFFRKVNLLNITPIEQNLSHANGEIKRWNDVKNC